jgi:hypothetical protein
MSKWAVNGNCPTTLLEFSGWEFEKNEVYSAVGAVTRS